MGTRVLAKAGCLQASSAGFGVCVRVAGQHLIADEVFDEGQRSAGCGVVGIGDTASTERTPHHLVIADNRFTNAIEDRWMGQSRAGCWQWVAGHEVCHQVAAGLHNAKGTAETANAREPARLVPVARVSVPVEVSPEIDEQVNEHVEQRANSQRPWITIVWNDPINLMSYVTYVFMNYFKYSREKAEKLMSDVHHEGRAVVSSGTREEMERDVAAMHSYGLWATLQKDD